MYNAVEEAKAQVKEIIMGALGRLVGEGKLPAEPLPPFQVTIPLTTATAISPRTPRWCPRRR